MSPKKEKHQIVYVEAESNFKAEEPENKHSAAIVRYVISAPEKMILVLK